jgi:uncharacterized membrane protein YdbT with pleckstrin-like domain
MSYVSSVLQPDEKVRYITHIHWMIFIPGGFFLALAVFAGVIAIVATEVQVAWTWISAFFLILALAALFRAWFQRATTEIAVTNRRIIHKWGFISRYTTEMQMDKVVTVDVMQTVMGRILGYGDIDIHGVGAVDATTESLKNIESPIEFRNQVTGR